jgi:Cd2+/Zn2+-exporting ATPase
MTETYILEGLCCKNCAAKIEAAAGQLAGVERAKVDFGRTNITIAFNGDGGAVLRGLAGICAEVDEDIVVKGA